MGLLEVLQLIYCARNVGHVFAEVGLMRARARLQALLNYGEQLVWHGRGLLQNDNVLLLARNLTCNAVINLGQQADNLRIFVA